MSVQRVKVFKDLLAQVADTYKKVLLLCSDDAVLEAVKAAKERHIADAILVGDEARLEQSLVF